MKPIEQHLAGFLLSLQRGSWTKAYNRQCLALWKEKYGDQVVARELLGRRHNTSPQFPANPTMPANPDVGVNTGIEGG